MTKVVTPSKKSIERKISKAVANYRALLEKHSVDFYPTAVQKVLEHPSLTKKQFDVFRDLVEKREYESTFTQRVVRGRLPEEVLKATGRTIVNDPFCKDAAKTMPSGNGDNVELVFFTFGVDASYWDVYRECESRNLISDPVALADFIAENNDFADLGPVGCQWLSDAKLYQCLFYNDSKGKRFVEVSQSFGDGVYGEEFRFAGVRKKL